MFVLNILHLETQKANTSHAIRSSANVVTTAANHH